MKKWCLTYFVCLIFALTAAEPARGVLINGFEKAEFGRVSGVLFITQDQGQYVYFGQGLISVSGDNGFAAGETSLLIPLIGSPMIAQGHENGTSGRSGVTFKWRETASILPNDSNNENAASSLYYDQWEAFDTLNNASTPDNEGASPVPEPATMLLMGTGLLGLAAARRLRSGK